MTSALLPAQQAALVSAVDELYAVLHEFRKRGQHPVQTIIADGVQPFTQFTHYPEGDIDDSDTGYAWYYHAHAPSDRRPWAEHGHFHCYAYTEIVPPGVEPVALPEQPDHNNGGLIHLIALCVNEAGVPCRLFTINRWASDEWLYPAQVVADLCRQFYLGNPRHELTSRWLGVMLRLLQPQIAWLLRERDLCIFPSHSDPSLNRSEDRDLEVTSTLGIDLDEHLAMIARFAD